MTLIKWLLILAVIGGGLFGYIIVDRDRSLWAFNTALKTATSRTVVSDVPYGDQPWQKLDIYPALNAASAPVIVFIHGGGWYHGRKDQYFFAADAFLRMGYTVVLPDYIKYPAPEAIFPSHLKDIAKAIAWVKNNIAEYSSDGTNLFLAGHSAGAHTVGLLSTDMHYLQAEGLSSSDIGAFAALAGPYNFTPDKPATRAVFGPESNYPLMNPLHYVDGDEPPALLLHSDIDRSVEKRHPREFEAALMSVGSDVETRIYTDLTHADMVTHLHPWLAGKETLALEIDRFFKARMRPSESVAGSAGK